MSTLVFDAPRRSRAFVEALIADNLCLGRPDELQLIFSRQVRNGVSYTEVPLQSPLVVLFGEERRGLTERDLDLCTHAATIPMAGPPIR